MNRFAKITLAAAALSLTALSAVPASAADVVVKLGGKTPAQISTELSQAAARVCRDQALKATVGSLSGCIDFVYNDAVAQLPATIVIPAR